MDASEWQALQSAWLSTTLTHDHGSEAAEEIILSLLLDLERYHVWVQTILFIIKI